MYWVDLLINKIFQSPIYFHLAISTVFMYSSAPTESTMVIGYVSFHQRHCLAFPFWSQWISLSHADSLLIQIYIRKSVTAFCCFPLLASGMWTFFSRTHPTVDKPRSLMPAPTSSNFVCLHLLHVGLNWCSGELLINFGFRKLSCSDFSKQKGNE